MAQKPSGTTPDEKAAVRQWSVRDKNARQELDGKIVARLHEAAPGSTYKLYFNEFTAMPEHHARTFLRDEAFEVLDEHGQRVRPLSEDAMLRVAPAALAPQMVIANLDELTSEALVTRASIKPGGSRYTSVTPREILINFLIDAEAAAQNTRRSDAGVGGGDVDDWVTDDTVKNALEAEMARG